MFGHGLMNDSKKLPVIDYTIIVSTEKFVDCFGAALFYDHGLAIVDCTHTNEQGIISNYFYYLDLTNHTVTKKVENPLYLPYTQINKR